MLPRSAKLLLWVLRAAHCRSTHHRFAIDALPLIRTQAGGRLAVQLLRHYKRYLAGATDPDLRFRDFHNHVIHVEDGCWGGAPRVAHQWYERLQQYLRTDRWSDAAHAAGVLSHYFTDPMQPLHTVQTSVERVLHRPIEWSVTTSYASLLAEWQRDSARTVFQLSDSPGWLGEAVLTAARVAYDHSETLVNHYNLRAARSHPPAAFDDISRDCLSQLIGLCVTGWSRVLERAAEDGERLRGRSLPQPDINIATFSAGIRIPTQSLIRWMQHRGERREVNEIIEEFAATGQVVQHLTREQRMIEKVCLIYHREREYNRLRAERQSGADVRILEFLEPQVDAPRSMERGDSIDLSEASGGRPLPFGKKAA